MRTLETNLLRNGLVRFSVPIVCVALIIFPVPGRATGPSNCLAQTAALAEMDGNSGRGYSAIPVGRIFSNAEVSAIAKAIGEVAAKPHTTAAFRLLQFFDPSQPAELGRLIGEGHAQKVFQFIAKVETELRRILPAGEFEKLRLGDAHLRNKNARVIEPEGHRHNRFWLTVVKGENRPSGEIGETGKWQTLGDENLVVFTDGDRARYYNAHYPDRETELKPTLHRTPVELGDGLILLLGYRHIDVDD